MTTGAADGPRRGRLRIYLGAAPGVGKTYAMLSEGHRRAGRGTDTVIGLVEAHGRPLTADMSEGFETVPRRVLRHRGSEFTEMDVDAVVARRPALALVDEYAHTNVPGARNTKRWQDVEELLAAGIDVVTTLNIQHLESLNDVVTKITGVPQRETVPDAVARAADQVELVDMAPEALRRRMAHGNVYAADKVDAALSNYFRVGNLTALRELALLWVAGQVEEQLDRYRADHGITATWEARERVVVALTGGPEGDTLIRRAARIAARFPGGGDLLAVHVSRPDGLVSGADPAALARQRDLVESLGGSYHQVLGDDVPAALLDFARAENATQLVLGASRRGRLAQVLSRGVGVTTTARSGSIDVHLVTHERSSAASGRGRPTGEEPAGGRRPHRPGAPGHGHGHGHSGDHRVVYRRQLAGFALAAATLVPLTAVAAATRSTLNLTSDILLYLLVVVAVAVVGGIWPALAAAVASSLLLNYYFAPPLHHWTVAEHNNTFALVVFVAVGVAVSRVVDLARRRSGQAARASAEAETLATLAGTVLRSEHPLPAILERARESFGMTSVALLESYSPDEDARTGPATPSTTAGAAAEPAKARTGRERWRVVASVGHRPCTRPSEGEVEVPAGHRFTLALRGRPLPAADRRLLAAFAAQAATATERLRLAEEAASARPLAEADRVRSALLTAVGHDLRAPLAAAKAAVTGLRAQDVAWSDEERAELVATADESLDRLTALVENLLDMSRLQAGVLSVFPRAVHAEDVVALALDGIGPDATGVRIGTEPADHGRDEIGDVGDVSEVPAIRADPVLLERVVANVVANAIRFSPAGTPPLITTSTLGGRVQIRVVDRGPGVPEADRDAIFQPFQRLGDTDNTTGTGLGLALSRGLIEAMDGTLTPEDTPGGGLTMVIDLPADADGEPRIEHGPGPDDGPGRDDGPGAAAGGGDAGSVR
ncbi:ATP-binding protein [Pseudofrankia sp. BMG5.36]|uniref:sensor histidine kinase n=1 Tax=Pseudofrankia sp. BMG5.36 TaxID=1834512 RepID=UPI0009F18AE8|nr:ATP-binding protein [Pseudofrankia sp. BMG5.36]